MAVGFTLAEILGRAPSCRKEPHETEGKALAAVRSLARRKMDRPELGRLRPYRCPRCGAWHTGHAREES